MQRHFVSIALTAVMACAGGAVADPGVAGVVTPMPAVRLPAGVLLPRTQPQGYLLRTPAPGYLGIPTGGTLRMAPLSGGGATFSTPAGVMRLQANAGGVGSGGGPARAKARSSNSNNDRTTINESGDDGKFTLVIEGDKIISATANGQPVPPDRIVRDGDVVHFLDANGQGMHDIQLRSAGGTWSYASPPRVRIGVTMDDVGEALAAQLGIEPGSAVVITSVIDGGPADKAGLQDYDVVTSIDGKSPVTTDTLAEAVRSKNPGDELRLHVRRKGQEKDIIVTVEKYQGDQSTIWTTPRAGGWGPSANLSPEQQQRLAEIQDRVREATERARARGLEAEERARATMERSLEKFRAARLGDMSKRLQEAFDEQLQQLDLHLDEETMTKINEALHKATDALSKMKLDIDFNMPEIQMLRQDGQGGVVVLQPGQAAPLAPPAPPAVNATPAPPAPGNAPGAESRMTPRNREPDDRFKSLENRMDRLETLLEKLVEQQQDSQSRQKRSN